MSALVEIRAVPKTYRRGSETIAVLHGVDLDIPRGDFVTLGLLPAIRAARLPITDALRTG